MEIPFITSSLTQVYWGLHCKQNRSNKTCAPHLKWYFKCANVMKIGSRSDCFKLVVSDLLVLLLPCHILGPCHSGVLFVLSHTSRDYCDKSRQAAVFLPVSTVCPAYSVQSISFPANSTKCTWLPVTTSREHLLWTLTFLDGSLMVMF